MVLLKPGMFKIKKKTAEIKNDTTGLMFLESQKTADPIQLSTSSGFPLIAISDTKNGSEESHDSLSFAFGGTGRPTFLDNERLTPGNLSKIRPGTWYDVYMEFSEITKTPSYVIFTSPVQA